VRGQRPGLCHEVVSASHKGMVWHFEGAFGLGHVLSAMGVLYDGNVGASLVGRQAVHACEDIVRRNCPPEMRDPPLRLAHCPCLQIELVRRDSPAQPVRPAPTVGTLSMPADRVGQAR